MNIRKVLGVTFFALFVVLCVTARSSSVLAQSSTQADTQVAKDDETNLDTACIARSGHQAVASFIAVQELSPCGNSRESSEERRASESALDRRTICYAVWFSFSGHAKLQRFQHSHSSACPRQRGPADSADVRLQLWRPHPDSDGDGDCLEWTCGSYHQLRTHGAEHRYQHARRRACCSRNTQRRSIG